MVRVVTGQIIFTIVVIALAAVGGYQLGYGHGHEDATREELSRE